MYADERINSGMKSLFVLCVGGRGEPMLAGRSGGGVWSQKSVTNKKGWSLAIYSFYKILSIS